MMLTRWMKVSAVIALLIAVVASFAAPEGDFGVRLVMNRNATLILNLAGTTYQEDTNPPGGGNHITAQNAIVSGTNVRFPAAASIFVDPLDPDPHWVDGWITQAKVEIQGHEVGSYAFSPNGTLDSAWRCRFASNWFPDATSVALKITASGMLVGSNNDIGYFTDESYTVNVLVYNHSMQYTTVEGLDGNGGFVVDPDSIQAVVGQRAMDAVRPILGNESPGEGTFLNYLVKPGTYGLESDMRKVSAGGNVGLDSYLKTSTLLFCVTHGLGEPTCVGIRSSHDDDLYWHWIDNAVSLNRTAPKISLCVLYVCGGGTGVTAAARFGTTPPDRGLAGFDEPIDATLYGTPQVDPWTLDLHAKKLFEELAAGNPLSVAAKNADRAFPVRAPDGVDEYGNQKWKPLAMKVADLPYGDPWMRAWFVYLTEGERTDFANSDPIQDVNTWYYVKQLAVSPG